MGPCSDSPWSAQLGRHWDAKRDPGFGCTGKVGGGGGNEGGGGGCWESFVCGAFDGGAWGVGDHHAFPGFGVGCGKRSGLDS